MDKVDCVVIGAGIVGLAVARAMAMAGREVIILESERAIGTGTSSRNSEVIHGGIYYPPGSLKATLCVEGKHRLYAFCASHGVAHRRCGKLIVATNDRQVGELEAIAANARASGVDDLQWLTAGEVARREPTLQTFGALLSPSTGIVDSHGLMLALQGDAQSAGAMLAFDARVVGARVGHAEGIELDVDTAGVTSTLRANIVVNSAGLYAVDVARTFVGLAPEYIPPRYYAKGSYFTCAQRAPFSHLIYPVPEPGGLGVHLTLDLAGQARFGPNVAWVDEIDYTVNAADGDGFYAAVRRYWPALADGALQPGYAGIRPKISAPGEPAADFRIDGPAVHGVAGLVNLFGIESPGLTASLAIAEAVRAAL
ncbi:MULTISPECIES: NAD(P)/FAD-dependent oxidoreductase [Pandoraea]|uniref:L-2-hydroxyglutarate oxidase LhgO n=1 Tax=Pandoraea cepalis TaxID=2508294 RepID=A0A5E4VC98_9BURK|nr:MULTISPECIES: NAD(P)/FAD-dependent oxidoreductase [Pandoraea]QBC31136.1 FAD-dependent oxidoreductase [Pandoraea sp. XY-2]VVE09908.1 L-2-hydroxyglutarate oxidase LhgO [Pandoraea cepalis]